MERAPASPSYTEQILSPGLKGVIERLLNPRILRGVYRQELANINQYTQVM